jgi:peptidyl-prolyl cis-trans isomerase B (cyclophilin B)
MKRGTSTGCRAAGAFNVFGLCLLLSSLALTLGSAAVINAESKRSHPLVKLETSMGDIVLELDAEKAPKTVANFLAYVEDGHYDNTIFHRVIDGFMIQGGGFTADMNQKPTKPPIENEADNGLTNEAYTVAMARTMDPHSASAQFFINVKKNDFLNHTAKTTQGWGYAVFGQVTEGKGVVNKIKGVPTGRQGMHDDMPQEPVTIIKAEVISK